MGDFTIHSRVRRTLLLLIPGAFSARLLPAQSSVIAPDSPTLDDEVRRRMGKNPQDEILKQDYEHNVKDAQELVNTAKSFQEDLEKDDRYVLSISTLKKLDDIEKLTKRIRGRLKRI